jgi:hypothetical protein
MKSSARSQFALIDRAPSRFAKENSKQLALTVMFSIFGSTAIGSEGSNSTGFIFLFVADHNEEWIIS